MARDALQVKKKTEELIAQKGSIRLAKRLQKINYLKVFMGLGQGLLRVDVSPSKYMPHTEYTSALKKEAQRSLSKGKGVIEQSARPFKHTSKALATKQRKYQGYPTFARAVQEVKTHDRTLEVHVVCKQVALAQYYKKLADNLLEANQELRALLDAEKSGMSTAAAVQAYQTTSENTQRAALLKEKACKLLLELDKQRYWHFDHVSPVPAVHSHPTPFQHLAQKLWYANFNLPSKPTPGKAR